MRNLLAKLLDNITRHLEVVQVDAIEATATEHKETDVRLGANTRGALGHRQHRDLTKVDALKQCHNDNFLWDPSMEQHFGNALDKEIHVPSYLPLFEHILTRRTEF